MMKKSYSTWGPSYKVSFSIIIKELPTNTWTSIIHFTKGKNDRNIGDRIPAVFLYFDKWFKTVRIVVCSAINRNRNFCRNFRAKMNKEYDITIQQSKKGGEYWYQLIVPGVNSRPFRNQMPRKFNNVKLFTSDPWYAAFTSDIGTISNLKIENHE